MIRENLRIIQTKIKDAALRAGRDPSKITLICVVKKRPLDAIKDAIDCGIKDIGENRIQEAKERFSLLNDVRRHMIGHLQSNKAKDAIEMFDVIHSVDNVKLAERLDRYARSYSKKQDILVEVDLTNIPTRYGVKPEDLKMVVSEILRFNNINLIGLMTIAPVVNNPDDARPFFRRLRELRDSLDIEGIKELSMGMSQDYVVAVEEGATMLRIGSAIFDRSEG